MKGFRLGVAGWLPVCALLLVIAAPLSWALLYPQESDPKNMRYVLWRHGLYQMDLDTATETMVGDLAQNRNRLVIGKTREQLIHKFGYLLSAQETSLYNSTCYLGSTYTGQDVAFIRRSSLDGRVFRRQGFRFGVDQRMLN